MSIILVATIVPDPESRAELVRAFEAAISAVHSEPGCELYALHENADCVVMIEKWADQDALDAHRQGAALKQLGRVLTGLTVDVKELHAHPVGSPGQGAL